MTKRLNEAALVEFVAAYAADIHGGICETRSVDLDTDLLDLGLDSVDVVLLTADLDDKFGIDLDPAFFLRQTTIRSILNALKQIGLAD